MLSAPAERIVPAMIAPKRPNSGAYGDWLPSLEQLRAEARADPGAGDEARQREHPDEEPAREPDEPEDDARSR